VAARNSTFTGVNFRFSGHQSFALRIAWIPKVVRQINAGKDPLTNSDDGIATLGLGRNMVESLRCWIEAFNIARRDSASGRWVLTDIGNRIFGPEGFDPDLDDPSTPWVLHWLISTNSTNRFWAWECMFNRWGTEFTAAEVLDVFTRQATPSEAYLSGNIEAALGGISPHVSPAARQKRRRSPRQRYVCAGANPRSGRAAKRSWKMGATLLIRYRTQGRYPSRALRFFYSRLVDS
jgi:hypothetical protein